MYKDVYIWFNHAFSLDRGGGIIFGIQSLVEM